MRTKLIIKFFTIATSISLSLIPMQTSIAAVQLICPTHNKASMQAFLHEVFDWFNQVNQADDKTLRQIKRYFNQNFEIRHNGRLIAKNYQDFYRGQRLSQKFIQEVQTHLPLDEIIFEGNKVAIHTKSSLRKIRRNPEIHEVMAVIEFDQCRISRWTEVSKKVRN